MYTNVNRIIHATADVCFLVNEEFHPTKSGHLSHVIAVIYPCT